MPTPGEIYSELVNRAKAEADQAAQAAQQSAQQQATASITELTNGLKATIEGQKALGARVEQIAEAIATRPAPRDTAPTPGTSFEDATGLPSAPFQSMASSAARSEAERVFDEKMGPLVREAEAVQAYGSDHADFDLGRMQRYVAANPDVQRVVKEAASKGAYAAGIEYAETHRQLSEKIKGQATTEARKDSRKQFINDTRPDAQVVGSGGSSNPAGLNVNPTPASAKQISDAFNHLNAGNPQKFIETFHLPNLPSEEDFQRLVQGPFA